LVGVVRGANAPLLTQTVSQQMGHEKKVKTESRSALPVAAMIRQTLNG
jgi:hypothetical protein